MSARNPPKKRSGRKTLRRRRKTRIDYKAVSPQTLLNLFGAKNVAIVNTLDDDVVINRVPPVTHCCFGSSFIKKPCSSLSKFQVVVLYCANDTCNASHTYADKLLSKCQGLAGRVILYKGGVYEWALLSFAHPSQYSFYSLKNKRVLS